MSLEKKDMKIAIFPGSFDPFTLGHASVVERGLSIFDKIIIAVGVNAEKKTMFTPEQRVAQISACYRENPRVEVCSYHTLTVALAEEKKATAILRSVRTSADWEYEREMALLNSKLSKSDIETIVLFADPQYEVLQSSLVRELINYKHDVSEFVPEAVNELLENSR